MFYFYHLFFVLRYPTNYLIFYMMNEDIKVHKSEKINQRSSI